MKVCALLLCTIGDACSLCDDWCSIGEKIQLFERLLGLQVSCCYDAQGRYQVSQSEISLHHYLHFAPLPLSPLLPPPPPLPPSSCPLLLPLIPQVEFSEYLTPQDLDNRRKCKKMFEGKVQEYLAQQGARVSSKHYHNAVRWEMYLFQ